MYRFGVPWHLAVSVAIVAALGLQVATYYQHRRLRRSFSWWMVEIQRWQARNAEALRKVDEYAKR